MEKESLPVSIVLGTYNGEKFLKEQLDSIINQTYTNMEIVVTDDASTDGTKSILEDYAKKDNRIKIYFNEKNIGLIKNFEKGVQQTHGEYIAFADQDDVWDVDKIEKLVSNLGDAMLVYCNSEYIDADGKTINRKLTDYRNPVNGRNLFLADEDSGMWVAGHALLFRRELLDAALPFTPYVPHDMWMACIAMLKGDIRFIPDALAFYRQHGNNACGALGSHNKKRPPSHEDKVKSSVGRIEALLSVLPSEEIEFRSYLEKMKTYLLHPTFANRVKKVTLRMKYANKIYAPRKRNIFRKWVKALKSF